MTATRQALAELVAKLDECLPHIDNLCFMEQNRGRPYTGPQFDKELAAARAALEASVEPAPEVSAEVPSELTAEVLDGLAGNERQAFGFQAAAFNDGVDAMLRAIKDWLASTPSPSSGAPSFPEGAK